MKKQSQTQTVSNEFNNLVVNAIDFLKTALDEITSNPKRTIIDFYTALELFIKARLMKEHWSLIITRPEAADSNKFLRGDFQSVSLKDARERLKNIVNDDIGDDVFNSFKEIGEYRNRLVHFHNETANLQEIVAKDVLRGLYFLNILLLNKWKLHFKPYEIELNEISQKAHKLRDFLKVKFEAIEGSILSDRESGIIYNKCLSCDFESSRKTHIYEQIYSGICRVCDFEEDCVEVCCQNCSMKVYVSGGFRICDYCSHTIEIDEVLVHLEPPTPFSKNSAIEYEEKMRQRANCNECDFINGTVLPVNDNFNQWFCVNCNKYVGGEFIEECARCGELFVGNQDGLLCHFCDDFWKYED
ncbi:MAG TPA: hypothetical protein VF596_08215 [Pyrinomonadaceae bacterium]|jgi:hypothetical protein